MLAAAFSWYQSLQTALQGSKGLDPILYQRITAGLDLDESIQTILQPYDRIAFKTALI